MRRTRTIGLMLVALSVASCQGLAGLDLAVLEQRGEATQRTRSGPVRPAVRPSSQGLGQTGQGLTSGNAAGKGAGAGADAGDATTSGLAGSLEPGTADPPDATSSGTTATEDATGTGTTVSPDGIGSGAAGAVPEASPSADTGTAPAVQPGSGPTTLSLGDTASVSLQAVLVRGLDASIQSVTFVPSPAIVTWKVQASNGAGELRVEQVEISMKAGTVSVPVGTVTAAPVEDPGFVLPSPPGGAASDGTSTVLRPPAELGWPTAFKPEASVSLPYPLPAEDVVAFLKENTDASRVTFEVRFLDPDGAYHASADGTAFVLTQTLQVR
ncbi:MAG: hypothetical protein VKQ33_03035 [Candidatus Sericytochromatia bacterium]|nr:hypothetical protein [Candidatus Sericytochromatia bacterium]